MPRRNTSHSDNWEFGGAPPLEESTPQAPKSRTRRAATAIAFTTLFFSGAALTAVAGDNVSRMAVEDSAAVEETTTAEAAAEAEAAAPAGAPAPEAAPAAEAAPAPAAEPEDLSPGTPAAAAEAAPAEDSSAPAGAASPAAPADEPADAATPGATPAHARAKTKPVVLLPDLKPAPEPEIEGPPSAATVWLNSALPDPTPPAKRLTHAFARQLAATAKGTGLDWAFLLGVLRAKGATGRTPADAATLAKLANRLAELRENGSLWATALAYGGSSELADRAIALTRYNRAVGLGALERGLESAKNRIGTRLLADPQVQIYGAGHGDIVRGRVDVRVLALIAYLHEAYGEVTVSCLITGHKLYARPGVVSAHIYGHAVDVAALGGDSILGNSEPGGLTENAVRDILLLPAEVMPRQVISLLGLGGPSFPLGNHANHIHVGY